MSLNRSSPVRTYFLRRLWQKGSCIFTGSLIQGFAMGVFLFPCSIPSGGAAGIAVLLNYWFGLPMSLGLWLSNISFLLLAVHYLGRISAIGTIMVITVTSVSVNYFDVYFHTPFENVWMNLLAGSLFLGIGISVLLQERVTNGGIGFVALAIAKRRQHNPGSVLFWLNGGIFLITAVVIDGKIIIQALLCQWLSTRIVKWLYPPLVPGKRPLYLGAWRKK